MNFYRLYNLPAGSNKWLAVVYATNRESNNNFMVQNLKLLDKIVLSGYDICYKGRTDMEMFSIFGQYICPTTLLCPRLVYIDI